MRSTRTGDTTWTDDDAGNQTCNGTTGDASAYTVRGATASNGTASYLTLVARNTDIRSRLVGSTTTCYLISSLSLSARKPGLP